jgi:hypothetical protein
MRIVVIGRGHVGGGLAKRWPAGSARDGFIQAGGGKHLGMGFWVADEDAAVHEADTMHHLADRLHDRFPTVPDAVVDEVVDQHFHELDGRPIREYVPVLVEHAATEDLRSLVAVR